MVFTRNYCISTFSPASSHSGAFYFAAPARTMFSRANLCSRFQRSAQRKPPLATLKSKQATLSARTSGRSAECQKRPTNTSFAAGRKNVVLRHSALLVIACTQLCLGIQCGKPLSGVFGFGIVEAEMQRGRQGAAGWDLLFQREIDQSQFVLQAGVGPV